MSVSTLEQSIRPYAPGDERAILESFNRTFAVDEGFSPRTLDEWRWRFARNPAGARVMLAVGDDGAVRAQFAGLGQRLVVEGDEVHACHVVDTFCDATVRGGIARRGLFAATRDAFVDAFGGLGAERDRLMLGMPAPAAWRVGRAHLGYELLMPVWRLEIPVDRVPPAAQDVRVETVERTPPETDALFARVAEERAALARRDRTHFAWRYEAAPGRDYVLGAARRDGELVGLAAIRHAAFDGARRTIVCDWLVPDGDADAAAALREWCAERARLAGVDVLLAVFSEHAPEFVRFQEADWRVSPSSYVLVGKSFERRRDLGWYARHLWWTLGDTDLV